MSVVQYLYPADAKCLNLEDIQEVLATSIPGASIIDCDSNSKRHATPNWASIEVCHPHSVARSLLCVSQSRPKGLNALCSAFSGNANLLIVRQAKKLVWAQLKAPRSISDRKLSCALADHFKILAAVLRRCNGAIHLPENEKLYSAAGFTRYANRMRGPASRKMSQLF